MIVKILVVMFAMRTTLAAAWGTCAPIRTPRSLVGKRCVSKPLYRQASAISDQELAVGDHFSSERKELIKQCLQSIGIDGDSLEQAAIQSIENPTKGYDGRYGKSAIKTYRSFVYAKQQTETTDVHMQQAAAQRCARQIDFLLKRHQSHEAEWVRHHDSGSTTSRTRVFPIVLLLDNLRSALNVGSLFRTADAAGCREVITTGITPHPGGSGSDKVRKSALGAERMVPSRHFETSQAALDYIRSELSGYKIIGLETTEKSQLYTDKIYPRDGVVLVLGNEVTGVDTKILSDVDELVEIPMFGAKNSLNVAVCAPVVVYEVLRQWTRN